MKKSVAEILGVPVAAYSMREARDVIARQLRESREPGKSRGSLPRPMQK